MIGNAEEFYKALEIPYQIVCIVSGEINNAASKKCVSYVVHIVIVKGYIIIGSF